jgi:hypothetical protein
VVPRFCPDCGARLHFESQAVRFAEHVQCFPPNAPGAVGALACGILSIFIPCIGIAFGIAAIAMGSEALRTIRLHPSGWRGRGKAAAGMGLGVMGTLLWIAVIL